jgi:hypothetical protein
MGGTEPKTAVPWQWRRSFWVRRAFLLPSPLLPSPLRLAFAPPAITTSHYSHSAVLRSTPATGQRPVLAERQSIRGTRVRGCRDEFLPPSAEDLNPKPTAGEPAACDQTAPLRAAAGNFFHATCRRPRRTLNPLTPPPARHTQCVFISQLTGMVGLSQAIWGNCGDFST